MGGKRFQIDLDKVVAATVLFILVVAFLGTFMDYQVLTHQGISLGGISLGDTLQKIGESIYNVFHAINPEAMEKIGQVGTNKKAKIGWSLMLIAIMLVAVYYTLIRVALDRISESVFDDHTKKQLSIIFTFVFVGFTILSPLFNIVVATMKALFEMATPMGVMVALLIFVIGCIFFIIGFGIRAGTILGGEGRRFVTESKIRIPVPNFIKSRLQSFIKVEGEYYDISGALKDLQKRIKGEVKSLEELKRKIDETKIHLDNIIRFLSQPGIKVENIDNVTKALENIVEELIEEEKINNLIIKEKIHDTKIEKVIEEKMPQLKEDINRVLSKVCKDIGIDTKEHKSIYKELIRDFIKEEHLLDVLKDLDKDIYYKLKSIQTNISTIRSKIINLKHMKGISVKELGMALSDIRSLLEEISHNIGEIIKKEIQEQNIIDALTGILEKNKTSLMEYVHRRFYSSHIIPPP